MLTVLVAIVAFPIVSGIAVFLSRQCTATAVTVPALYMDTALESATCAQSYFRYYAMGTTGDDDGSTLKAFGACDGSKYLKYCDGYPLVTGVFTDAEYADVGLQPTSPLVTSAYACDLTLDDVPEVRGASKNNDAYILNQYGLIAAVAIVCPSTAGVIGSALGYLGLFELAAAILWIVLLTSTGLMHKKGENSSNKFNLLKEILGDKAADAGGALSGAPGELGVV